MSDVWFQLRSPGAPDRSVSRAMGNTVPSHEGDEFAQNLAHADALLIGFSYLGTTDEMTKDQKDEMSEQFLVQHYRELGGVMYWARPLNSGSTQEQIRALNEAQQFNFLSQFLAVRQAELNSRYLRAAEQVEVEVLGRRIQLIQTALEHYPPVRGRGPSTSVNKFFPISTQGSSERSRR